jgi:tRNA threonylcarbamoyladenosine biosynthesis protein TsaB
MLILGFDTSSPIGSIGIINGEEILAETTFNTFSHHGEWLIPQIKEMLDKVGLEIKAVEGLSVSLGPGSFTGLRIGVATARTLAQTLNLPLVSVSAFEALVSALPACEDFIRPIIESRRQEVYTALYKNNRTGIKEIEPPEVISFNQLIEKLSHKPKTYLTGPALFTYRERIFKEGLRNIAASPPELCYPRGLEIARLGEVKILRGEIPPLDSLEPLYFHPPPVRKCKTL